MPRGGLVPWAGPAPGPEVALAEAERLPRSVLLAYSAPGAAYMAGHIAVSVWLMKHATDVLLIAPAVMGVVLLSARLWDAVSDPMAGYWSDRTQSRFGRRRSWLALSVPLVAVTLVAVWSPPPGLSGAWLVAWMVTALLLWETASTGFYVPHQALGLELTSGHHERTRLFAWKHVITMLGYGLGMVAVYGMRTASSPRTAAFWIAAAAGALLVATVWSALPWLRERNQHRGRGALRAGRAFRDVLANPHARVLFVVYAVEMFGMGIVSTYAPYVMEDVVQRPDLLEVLLATWMIPQFLLAPAWIGLSRRLGKKRLWSIGIALTSIGFAGQFSLGAGDWPIVLVLVFLLGVGGGIGNVLTPSIQADVVDYDEWQSGERKEGAYVAVWNFVRKAGFALAAGAGGIALSVAGYDGAAETQSETVRTMIRTVTGIVPALLYAGAFVLLSRFALDEATHAKLVSEIAAREAAPAD